jgi:hypothetical protein
LLPGGANPVPGRDFHPQSTSAFSRRTCTRYLSPATSEDPNFRVLAFAGDPHTCGRRTHYEFLPRTLQWIHLLAAFERQIHSSHTPNRKILLLLFPSKLEVALAQALGPSPQQFCAESHKAITRGGNQSKLPHRPYSFTRTQLEIFRFHDDQVVGHDDWIACRLIAWSSKSGSRSP